MKKYKLFCMLIALLLFLSSCAKRPQKYLQPVFTIKAGHANKAGDPSYEAWIFFKQELEKQSDGFFQVDLLAEGILGDESELIYQITNNSLDMATVNVAPLCNLFGKFNIFVLPYLWKDQKHLFRFCDSQWGQVLSDEFFNRTGIKLLSYWDNGVRNTFQTDKPIYSPADFKGMKIRVMNNEVYLKFFNALGAEAIPMPFGEVHTALSTNIVEAADNDTSGYISMKFYEPAKYFSLTAHVVTCKPLLASDAFWQRISLLPVEKREIFMRVLAKTALWQRREYENASTKDLKWMQENGIKVNSIANPQEFRDIAEKYVWKDYYNIIGKDLIDKAKEMAVE